MESEETKKIDGRKISGKNSAIAKNKEVRGMQNAVFNKFQEQEAINKIIQWRIDGIGSKEIEEKILKEYKELNLGQSNIDKIKRKSLDALEEISKEDAEIVVSIHVGWYEEIFKYFNKINYSAGIRKAMRGKEKLLGLLKEPKLTINQKINKTITREVDYDLSKLPEDKKVRLNQLLNKAK